MFTGEQPRGHARRRRGHGAPRRLGQVGSQQAAVATPGLGSQKGAVGGGYEGGPAEVAFWPGRPYCK